MTAGQTIEVIMEMDFRLTDVPKDWSLVANGNMGGVTISHSDAAIVTDHMTQAPTPVDPVDLASFNDNVNAYQPGECSGLREQRYTNVAGSDGY